MMTKGITISLIILLCSFAGMACKITLPHQPQRDVVINEIAWMGTTTSAFDEWMELKNTTGEAIDLNGWTITNEDQSLTITLAFTIPPYGYAILERTEDSAIPDVLASQIYSGALSNSGDYLYLKDDGAVIQDEVDTTVAGDVTTRSTMERVDPIVAGDVATNWKNATELYFGGFGTPLSINGAFSDGEVSDINCRYPKNLEITSINIGQGDATLIATRTRLMLADAGESYWNSHMDADVIADTLHELYGAECNTLDYVVISHFHTDHIGYVRGQEDASGNLLNAAGGLLTVGDNLLDVEFLSGYAYLIGERGIVVKSTLIRDFNSHNPNKSPSQGGSKAFRNWRALLSSPDGIALFHPTTAGLGKNQIVLGSIDGIPVEVDIVLVDGATPANPNGCDPATYFGGAQYLIRGDRSNDPVTPSENDLSVGFVLSYNEFQLYIAGDQSGDNENSGWGYRYHDTESCLAEDTTVGSRYSGRLEVLRANHHGSSHSSNQQFVDFWQPQVMIFSVGDNNNYDHVDRTVLERALSTSVGIQNGAVFLTESGANVFSATDVCHSAELSWCAEVADGEFPAVLESNESEDDGVRIWVKPGGIEYEVQGNQGVPRQQYNAR